MFGIGGLKMPYKIFVEETVRLKHLITVECDEDITVLSVEEEIDRYDCDCFELDDIIPCEEGN